MNRKPIRLKCDLGARVTDMMKDVNSQSTPEIWRGNDVDIQFGVFLGDTVQSVGDLASVALTIKAQNRTGAPLVLVTIGQQELDNTLDAATWADGSKQHGVIPLSGAQTNLALNAEYQMFWLVLHALTTDAPAREITLGATLLRIEEDAAGGNYAPPDPAELYYTREHADGRYLPLHAPNSNRRFSNGLWYTYIAETGLWYPEVGALVDGVPVITLGEGIVL